MVFPAAFRPWEGGSRHQFLGGFPLPHGYPPASSPGARRMNADPWSAFRLSPLREPDARTRADRFNVRATSRTCTLSSCQRTLRRRAKWAARALESSSAVLQTAADQPSVGARVSATSPGCESGTKKGPMSLVTPGLLERLQKVTCVTSARYARAPYSPVHRRNTRCMSVVRWYSTFVITLLLSYARAARRAASLG